MEEGYADILGAEVGSSSTAASGGNWYDGWGAALGETAKYAARAYIDAEVNERTMTAQRQMALRGEDGELYGAGDVESAANRFGGSWLPWLLIGGAVLAVVLIVKD